MDMMISEETKKKATAKPADRPKHAATEDTLSAKSLRRKSFIAEQGPSSLAAAERLARTNEFLFTWKQDLNATDTKNMPRDLKEAYQVAFETLTFICEVEREIALRGEK